MHEPHKKLRIAYFYVSWTNFCLSYKKHKIVDNSRTRARIRILKTVLNSSECTGCLCWEYTSNQIRYLSLELLQWRLKDSGTCISSSHIIITKLQTVLQKISKLINTQCIISLSSWIYTWHESAAHTETWTRLSSRWGPLYRARTKVKNVSLVQENSKWHRCTEPT